MAGRARRLLPLIPAPGQVVVQETGAKVVRSRPGLDCDDAAVTDHTYGAEGGYGELRALFINGTLKRSPDLSHTEGLITRSQSIMACSPT